MVQAMGGADATYEKAAAAYAEGDFLWACQLGDYTAKAADTPENRQLAADCLRQVAYRALSTNTRSWYLSDALALEGQTAILDLGARHPGGGGQQSQRLRELLSRSGERRPLRGHGQAARAPVRRLGAPMACTCGEASSISCRTSPASSGHRTCAVSLTPETWTLVFNNLADPAALIDAGEISVVQGERGGRQGALRHVRSG